jgi:hypothetical protein
VSGRSHFERDTSSHQIVARLLRLPRVVFDTRILAAQGAAEREMHITHVSAAVRQFVS